MVPLSEPVALLSEAEAKVKEKVKVAAKVLEVVKMAALTAHS